MEQSKHTETIRELVAQARDIDRQVEQLAKGLHLAQVALNEELDGRGVTIEDEDVWGWYEETGILELRALAEAIDVRLSAAEDDARPGEGRIPGFQRDQFAKYGIGGFAIDPYREPEAVTA